MLVQWDSTDEYNIFAVVMEFLRTEIFETELDGAVGGEGLGVNLSDLEEYEESYSTTR